MEISIERICALGADTGNYSRWVALEVVGTSIEDWNGGHLSRRLLRFFQDERAHVDENAKDDPSVPDQDGRGQQI